jgi:hypothetical protein
MSEGGHCAVGVDEHNNQVDCQAGGDTDCVGTDMTGNCLQILVELMRENESNVTSVKEIFHVWSKGRLHKVQFENDWKGEGRHHSKHPSH